MEKGNHWLSFHIYLKSEQADSLISNGIYYFASIFMNEDLIDKWFFIRYPTPEFHLRVRFLVKDIGRKEEILYMFKNGMRMEVNAKIELADYEREWSRYGVDTLPIIESIFQHDSRMVAELIDVLEEDSSEQIRWYISFRIIQTYLDCFGLNNEEQLNLILKGREYFLKEFDNAQTLAEEFEEDKESIETILRFTRDEIPEFSVLLDILDEFQAKVKPLSQQVIQGLPPTIDLGHIIRSLIHLDINRLFVNDQRKLESRLYCSLLHAKLD